MKPSASFLKLCAIAAVNVFLCVTPVFVKAQSLTAGEIIGHLTDDSRQQTYRFGIALIDLQKHFNKGKFDEIKKQVTQNINKDRNLRLGVRFFMYERVAMQEMGLPDPEANRTNYLEKLAEANSLEDKQLLSDLCVKYANLCVSTEKLYYLLKCVQIRENIGVEYFSDLSSNYYHISELLYQNADYKNAAFYANKAAKFFTLKDKYLVNYILLADIAGSANLKINQPNVAYAYYKDIETRVVECIARKFASCKAMNNSLANIWLGIAKGGTARSLMLKGDHAKAYPLLLENLRSSVHYQQWGDAALVQNSLAQLELKQLKTQNALSRYLKAYKLAVSENQLPLLIDITNGLKKTYAGLGQYDSAYQYQKKEMLFRAQLDSSAYQTRLNFVNTNVAFDKVNEDFEHAQNKLKRQKYLRNIILIGVVVCAAIAILLFYARELRSKLLLANAERDKQRLIFEQEISRKEIASFVEKIAEKNKFINELKGQLETATDKPKLEALIKVTILTEEDWQKFKVDFDKANPSYLSRMHEKLPRLTIGEQRIIMLAKLGLLNKEMASAAGVSLETIRSVISRLRKKFNLEEDIYKIADQI